MRKLGPCSAESGFLCISLVTIFSVLGGNAFAQPVTLEFSTRSAQGKYSPNHVLAAWVTDHNTNFIKTLARYGNKRHKYLETWKQARGEESAIDGVTGATLKSHDIVTVKWDRCDANKKPVKTGTYLLFVEFTDAHRQGPLATFPVTIAPEAQTKSFPDQEYFKSIKLSYTPAK